MGLIEELKWRGLYYDMIPGTDKYLEHNRAKGYIGFDPTARSLGIGNLVQIIILMHFQRYGHQPLAVVGGATGMIGDPSGKSDERNLLSVDQLNGNVEILKKQLGHYLDFDDKTNPAIIVNNYDWYGKMNVLTYLREVGKNLTVSYMMAKDSVKSRLSTGISYTEFSYQILQAYDFYRLYTDYGCKIQMGGSDQWGNLTAGVELIRKLSGAEAFAVTTPLITKADGTKFGKTEQGNIYIGEELTSAYKFYQFWLNATDADAENFIKVFTFLSREIIEDLIKEHREDPGRRNLQKRLAEEVTVLVHSKSALEKVKQASDILFGKSTTDTLKSLSGPELLEIFEGVPIHSISRDQLSNGINIIDLLSQTSPVFNSKGEVRRMMKDNGLRLNKERVSDPDYLVGMNDLLNERYILIQKGKKNYHLLEAGS